MILLALRRYGLWAALVLIALDLVVGSALIAWELRLVRDAWGS